MGIYVLSFAQEILAKYEFIDYVCLNESEFIITNFFKDVLYDLMLFSRINSIIINDFNNSVEDFLESDWFFFELSNYIFLFIGEKFLMINFIRGCFWKCSFCIVFNFYGNKLCFRLIK